MTLEAAPVGDLHAWERPSTAYRTPSKSTASWAPMTVPGGA